MAHARIEDALGRWAESPPAVDALVDGDRRYDYPALYDWALRFAGELARAKLGRGDRVAIHLDKVAESVVAMYGTWLAGGVVVPVNESLRTPQVVHILRDSGARLFVSDPRKLARLDAEVTRDVHALEVAPREELPPHARPEGLEGDETPAAILYTSGSTGKPKGILISHQNLLAGSRIVSTYLEIQPDERILSVLPFSFDYGLNQLMTSVYCGCTLVLQRSHFPADLCRALEQHRITGLGGVPPLWIQLMGKMSPLPKMELPHLRYITNSGGVFPPDLVRAYRAKFPDTRIYLMYGLSEAFRSTFLPPSEVDRIPESMGKAIPECDVFVVDANDKLCPPGEPGELVHRGPTVALGYWNDPETTARVFRPDPHQPGAIRKVVYSGDVVKTDEEGFLYFVTRRDQMIKSSGYRISPEEVEDLIYQSKLVAEVVVHGRPDPVAGAAVVAHVVPVAPASFELKALVDYCRSEMPAYMVPKDIQIHDAFPRTASGKIDRKSVAHAYMAKLDAATTANGKP